MFTARPASRQLRTATSSRPNSMAVRVLSATASIHGPGATQMRTKSKPRATSAARVAGGTWTGQDEGLRNGLAEYAVFGSSGFTTVGPMKGHMILMPLMPRKATLCPVPTRLVVSAAGTSAAVFLPSEQEDCATDGASA